MYLKDENMIWAAQASDKVLMIPKMANRHGLVAGATGTGKTVTIKMLAESFSDMGVPVFLADIKGDVSGMCQPGVANEHVDKRVTEYNITNFAYTAYPVRFFDVFGKKGIAIRTTVSDMGPDMLARILQLNDTQTGVLTIVFKIADDNGLLLLDMKDLRAMLQYVGDHHADYQTTYGNISAQSVGAIQRAMVALEASGGDVFFGEPELDIHDWMQVDQSGKGYINLLNCVELVQNPLLYSTFLLWMLSDLYENLPEAGDLDKPKMVFFFDEAHLLFNDAPKALLQKVEQVARLIRSKGVGIYFITQSPSDIPDTVLSQLGNKIQHALRAYTPKDQKAVKTAAESFRPNPAFDSEQTIGELGTGEALVSFLDAEGAPSMVERAFILPPQSFMGVAPEDVVSGMIQACPLYAKYHEAVDRESAYEKLQQNAVTEDEKKKQAELDKQREKDQAEREAAWEKEQKEKQKELEKQQKELEKLQKQKEAAAEKAAKKRSSVFQKAMTNTLSSVGRELGRDILRGLMGNRKR